MGGSDQRRNCGCSMCRIKEGADVTAFVRPSKTPEGDALLCCKC